MKIKVDQNLCICCGLCCGICDEVFRMNEYEKAEANQQTMTIKAPCRMQLIRVLCLQSLGKINSSASIYFFD